MAQSLLERTGSTAFVFRGYNVTNLGRSAELLAHPKYGHTVEVMLRRASGICSDVVRRKVDLVDRVRREQETTLETYDEALSLIVAMELAQIQLLEDFFGVRYAGAKLAYGYSLGELTAVVASGVFQLEQALRLPLSVAADCIALAKGVTMGVLFSRGPVLDFDLVHRLCLQITGEGRGTIGISAYLAPNTVLLLGQGPTIDRFTQVMHDEFPDRVYLRKNSDRWAPVHTSIVWQRNIPNRVGVMMETLPGGFNEPHPPVLSLVTGKLSYNHYNARQLLNQWIDHPQRLWDAVYETLATGIEVVVHVGPDPKLILATFHRLSDNVRAQLAGNSFNSIGLRAVARALRRPWLTAVLPSRTALLRAPRLKHIVLEDWLLTHGG